MNSLYVLRSYHDVQFGAPYLSPGKPPDLLMGSSEIMGEHVGGFDWAIWKQWQRLDEWIAHGSVSTEAEHLVGYHRVEICGSSHGPGATALC